MNLEDYWRPSAERRDQCLHPGNAEPCPAGQCAVAPAEEQPAPRLLRAVDGELAASDLVPAGLDGPIGLDSQSEICTILEVEVVFIVVRVPSRIGRVPAPDGQVVPDVLGKGFSLLVAASGGRGLGRGLPRPKLHRHHSSSLSCAARCRKLCRVDNCSTTSPFLTSREWEQVPEVGFFWVLGCYSLRRLPRFSTYSKVGGSSPSRRASRSSPLLNSRPRRYPPRSWCVSFSDA